MDEHAIFELIERYGFHVIVICGVGISIVLGSVIRMKLKKKPHTDSTKYDSLN